MKLFTRIIGVGLALFLGSSLLLVAAGGWTSWNMKLGLHNSASDLASPRFPSRRSGPLSVADRFGGAGQAVGAVLRKSGRSTQRTTFTGSDTPTDSSLQSLRIDQVSPTLILLSWPTNGTSTIVQAKWALDPGAPWATLQPAPELKGDHWILTLPLVGASRFFRLLR